MKLRHSLGLRVTVLALSSLRLSVGVNAGERSSTFVFEDTRWLVLDNLKTIT